MDFDDSEWLNFDVNEEGCDDDWLECYEAENYEDVFDWYELCDLNDEESDLVWEHPQQFFSCKSTKNPPSQGDTLFVRNLAKSVDVQQLSTLFAPFGTIARVNIIKDALGTSKGFGFVHFTNASDAGKALAKMNGHLLAGRKLHVAMAHPPKRGTKK